MSKVVERAVAKQLNEYLITNDLLPHYQSAFRKHHSTETAMLRVLSDALTAADSQRVTLLGLLDLSGSQLHSTAWTTHCCCCFSSATLVSSTLF